MPNSAVWPDGPLGGAVLVGTSSFLSLRPARGKRVRSQPVEGRKRGSRAPLLEGQLSQGLLPAQFVVREADRAGLPLFLAPVLGGPWSAARKGWVSGGSWPRLPLPWSVRGSSSPNG